jgi:hypothetical protein
VKWTPLHKSLLGKAVVCRGWFVNEVNLLAAADLVKSGYGSVHDADEGHVRLDATERGERRAVALGLAARREDGKFDGWNFGPKYEDVRE